MKDFVVNIIHRPELSPEYAERALGKKTDVQDESLNIFLFQQETAHKYGLKTTIQMTYASLFSDKVVAIAKEHHARFGDEIALSLLGLPCRQFREKYHTEDFCIWMFDKKTKESIIDDAFGMFHENSASGRRARAAISWTPTPSTISKHITQASSALWPPAGGGAQGVSHLQQLLVHLYGRRPVESLDPLQGQLPLSRRG